MNFQARCRQVHRTNIAALMGGQDFTNLGQTLDMYSEIFLMDSLTVDDYRWSSVDRSNYSTFFLPTKIKCTQKNEKIVGVEGKTIENPKDGFDFL